MVMGERGRASALQLWMVLVLCISVTLQCKILKCNSEFWASASPSGQHQQHQQQQQQQQQQQEEEEFCAALRSYNGCVRRTARTCRGDLAYHSAQHGILDLMSQHNCSKEGSAPRTPPPDPPTPRPPDLQERSDDPETCDYERGLARAAGAAAASANYSHCGFFGDPHLRTFADAFQTCRVEGAWPLIHNRYLSVQVTNSPVVPGSAATAATKLTIIFKNFPECVEEKTYHAETDELPLAFADGSRSGGTGTGGGTGALRVLDKVPGEHVEIQARYIGTTLVVRQVGRYLTFAARMPEEVATAVEDEGDAQDLYLCLHGCPASQRVDVRSVRVRAAEPAPPAEATATAAAGGGFTEQSARARCKERLPVEDLYFQSCVFDLLSSGDANFTMAAFYAFEDVKTLHAHRERHHIYDEEAFAGGAAHGGGHFLLFLLLLLFLTVSL